MRHEYQETHLIGIKRNIVSVNIKNKLSKNKAETMKQEWKMRK